MAFAYAFNSTLSYGEILKRLNELGPWDWVDADSAWYGNLARARTDSLKLDLLESGPNGAGGTVDAGGGRRYAFSARPQRDQPPTAHEWAALEEAVTNEVLPLLGATEVVPTDTVD